MPWPASFRPIPVWKSTSASETHLIPTQAYPGLFPTVGTKLVKRGPFKSKRDMYAALDTDVERAALRKYDAAIVLNARDSAVMQYKTSQICKYECGRGKGGGYRDEQIRQVQTNRR